MVSWKPLMRMIINFNVANKQEIHVLSLFVTGVWCYE